MSKPTKRLFAVTITREVIVVADDLDDALVTGQHDIDDDGDPDVSATPMVALPGDWELTSLPYGYRDPDDPDRTVGQWIHRGAAPEYTAFLNQLERTKLERAPFDELLARSSLGTPEAVATRKQADPQIVERILARADELQVARDTLREVEREARAAKTVDEAVDLLMAELSVEVARRLAAAKGTS